MSDNRRHADAGQCLLALTKPAHASAPAPAAKALATRPAATTSPALAEKLQARLRELGLDQASVTAVATKPGQPAHVRIQSVPIDRLSVLKKAL